MTIFAYIDARIEAYKRAATEKTNEGKTDHAYDLRIGAQTLGVLRGDLQAGLHLPDVPPETIDCAHLVEIAVQTASGPAMQCEACKALRYVDGRGTYEPGMGRL